MYSARKEPKEGRAGQQGLTVLSGVCAVLSCFVHACGRNNPTPHPGIMAGQYHKGEIPG